MVLDANINSKTTRCPDIVIMIISAIIQFVILIINHQFIFNFINSYLTSKAIPKFTISQRFTENEQKVIIFFYLRKLIGKVISLVS